MLDFLKSRPQRVSDWQSHLLYVSAEHRSPPGLCAQPPPVHTVHPLLQSKTSGELYREVCRQHDHHRLYYKEW